MFVRFSSSPPKVKGLTLVFRSIFRTFSESLNPATNHFKVKANPLTFYEQKVTANPLTFYEQKVNANLLTFYGQQVKANPSTFYRQQVIANPP